eukprot:GILK01005934.1.p1 GENE.GILK01005934.1~~GILK01005934.1.p1  ORF type:complete len:417 (-),score=57.52 GILK01005934.1:214-1428(-)
MKPSGSSLYLPAMPISKDLSPVARRRSSIVSIRVPASPTSMLSSPHVSKGDHHHLSPTYLSPHQSRRPSACIDTTEETCGTNLTVLRVRRLSSVSDNESPPSPSVSVTSPPPLVIQQPASPVSPSSPTASAFQKHLAINTVHRFSMSQFEPESPISPTLRRKSAVATGLFVNGSSDRNKVGTTDGKFISDQVQSKGPSHIKDVVKKLSSTVQRGARILLDKIQNAVTLTDEDASRFESTACHELFTSIHLNLSTVLYIIRKEVFRLGGSAKPKKPRDCPSSVESFSQLKFIVNHLSPSMNLLETLCIDRFKAGTDASKSLCDMDVESLSETEVCMKDTLLAMDDLIAALRIGRLDLSHLGVTGRFKRVNTKKPEPVNLRAQRRSSFLDGPLPRSSLVNWQVPRK